MDVPKSRGFTFIELVVAVAIIGILAAISYPLYTTQIRKGRRATAQAHLMDIAQREQQYLITSRSYWADAATPSNLSGLGGLTTPASVSTYYTVTLSAPASTPPTFSAVATPITGGDQAKDLGGAALSIDQTGTKAPAGAW